MPYLTDCYQIHLSDYKTNNLFHRKKPNELVWKSHLFHEHYIILNCVSQIKWQLDAGLSFQMLESTKTFISYFEKAHVTLTFTPQYNKPKPLSSAFLSFVDLYLITFGIKELGNHCKGVMDSHVHSCTTHTISNETFIIEWMTRAARNLCDKIVGSENHSVFLVSTLRHIMRDTFVLSFWLDLNPLHDNFE